MKTILLPTDFSTVAHNAALYAIAFAKQVKANKIILYNAYQTPVNIDPAMPAIQLLDIDDLKRTSEENLQQFKKELSAHTDNTVVLETLSEFNLLAENIDDVCEKVQADIIIMGITGKSKVEEVLIGSNTISVADNANVPVIIVPAETTYKPIQQVVFACDFRKVVENTPVAAMRKVMQATGAALHVVHVEKTASNETAFESLMLDTLLEGLQPQYHFVKHDDFVEGINQFAHEINADLIITIPKKHGWFEGLFKTRHTKKLAFHTHLPLMVIHD